MGQRWIFQVLPLSVLLIGGLLLLGVTWSVQAALGGGEGLPISLSVPGLPPAHDEADGALSPIFTREVHHWTPQILKWAESHGLDPNLVATVMQIESCGHPGAVSTSGAQGLFQVMPFHFTEGENMQDPDTNAARGLDYLALGLQRAAGQVGLALAGYNGGHSMIGRDSSLWPNETRRYFYWATGIYADASAGAVESARLQEWLAAGGASLCVRAGEALGLSNEAN